jgi:trans-aconitate methyltransferase
MIRMARSRWPQGDWRIGDMRDLDLPDPVDGIIGWNSFFYLTRAEQRALLPRLADLLAPGGALMLTVGPDDGAAAGRVGVDRVHHTSLSQAAYRTILARAGMAVIAFVVEDPGCDFQTILLARKRVAVPA